tara:strand:+ start:261 stop:641 length:381 start_codon:yes stop_codon:yes gene_type:complete
MQVSELEINDEHDVISKESPLSLAAEKILKLARGVLVVIDEENKPLGILSDSHLLSALANEVDATEICGEHVDINILCVKLSDNIKDIMDMRNRKPSAIIVIDEEGLFSGYVSPNDYREALSVIHS